MLDLKFIVNNIELLKKNCEDRNVEVDLSGIEEMYKKSIELGKTHDELVNRSRVVSNQARSEDPSVRERMYYEASALKNEALKAGFEKDEIIKRINEIVYEIPNLTHDSSPRGDESNNAILKEVGDRPNIENPLDHVELSEKHDLIDFKSGAKVAGSGFYFLKNDAALLELALVSFASRVAMQNGYTLFTTPDLAKNEILSGTGYNPRSASSQIYSISDSDLSLVATSEITLGGSLKNEIINAQDLPLRMVGISHCFRRETGSAGRENRGIYRVHQFSKVELFCCTEPDLEKSEEMHREILNIEESIFRQLEIPYRVIDIASHGLGGPAFRKIDIEAWMPGRKSYGEVTSASNCTDYQSRRLGIKCKKNGVKGTRLVHTLNGTAIAVTRAIVAIIENNQQKDGTILVPKVLQPYIDKEVINN